jgi:hypothetical protein
MGREMNRLSARRVETMREPGRHADGGGLYVSISTNGGRRWVFFYKWRGKQTEMGLRSARDVSLARARVLAGEARALIASGTNPLDAKRQSQVQVITRRPPTFGECADSLLEVMSPSWRNDKHRAQWETSLGKRDATRGGEAYAKPLRGKPV